MTRTCVLAFILAALTPAWAQAQLPTDFSFVTGPFYAVDATGRVISQVRNWDDPSVKMLHMGFTYKVLLTPNGFYAVPNTSLAGFLYTDTACGTSPYLGASYSSGPENAWFQDGTLYLEDPTAPTQMLLIRSYGAGPTQCYSTGPQASPIKVTVPVLVPNFMANYPLPWTITPSPFANGGGPISNSNFPSVITAPKTPAFTIGK